MTQLEWGKAPRWLDEGLSQGVLYFDDTGVVWNGLVSVVEQDDSSVGTDSYFDGVRMRVDQQTGDFNAKVTAYTYPDQVEEGARLVGMCYRNERGKNYILHLVYNTTFTVDVRGWGTTTATPDPAMFTWSVLAGAVPVPESRPSGHLALELVEGSPLAAELEDILYGTDDTKPRLPLPAEVLALYEKYMDFLVKYNGDGTYTVSGSDDIVHELSGGRFVINASSVFLLNAGIFTASSY